MGREKFEGQEGAEVPGLGAGSTQCHSCRQTALGKEEALRE